MAKTDGTNTTTGQMTLAKVSHQHIHLSLSILETVSRDPALPPSPPPIVAETSCDTLQAALGLLPPFQHRIIKEAMQVATDIEIW
jgi:hypothetical protein